MASGRAAASRSVGDASAFLACLLDASVMVVNRLAARTGIPSPWALEVESRGISVLDADGAASPISPGHPC